MVVFLGGQSFKILVFTFQNESTFEEITDDETTSNRPVHDVTSSFEIIPSMLKAELNQISM